MKKFTKFFLCVLLLLGSFLAFPACTGQPTDDTGFVPQPHIEEYFTAGISDGAYAGKYDTQLEAFCSDKGVGFSHNSHPIVAIKTVQIKQVSAWCYNAGMKFLNEPDTWTTTIYTQNYTISAEEDFRKKLTMTPASNPDLPEILKAGDEINFFAYVGTDGDDWNFQIDGLKIVIVTEDFPNGVYLK